MYNQQVQPKVLVRPRSSISTDDHHRLKPKVKPQPIRDGPSKALLTLVGLCIFLFVLCICVTAALVLVGRSLVDVKLINSTNNNSKSRFTGGFYEISKSFDQDLLNFSSGSERGNSEFNVKGNLPKIVLRLNQNTSIRNYQPAKGSKSDEDMALSPPISKIIQHLSFRLPRQIRPKNYNLFLQPNLTDKTFTGNVSIRLEILEPISYIPIHSKKLNITETKIFKVSAEDKLIPLNIHQTFEYAPHEYWVTELENELDVGEYSLNLSFNGSLASRIVGFYQSSYFDTKSKKKRYIASSKFEPTYARQAFPCFDEPAMKAKFKVTIARPSNDNYIALSNMDEIKQEEHGDVTHVQFRESVEMSTYLACFIVCDFEPESREINTGGIGDPFKMRAFATPGQTDKIKFALETGAQITEYYIRYFKIQYPLPKLDLIAIPDFVSGAMEHWGLVTFRETALLYDKAVSSTVNKQRVGMTVAHELAHMWFGNLVTMKWWDDLWLNEGFASYIEYKGLDSAQPSWKVMDQFIVEDLHGVMNLDATTASHPIVQKVETPDQITELFDAITYQKGSSVIRMLEDFVGPDIFQQAVQNYLEEFKYKNAVTDDFLTKIAELLPKIEVKYIMQTWTEQMGLPVVNVEKVNDTTFKLTQKRFFSNPEDEGKQIDDSPFNYKWCIPITFVTEENNSVERIWFNNQDTEATINLEGPVKWIKINKNQVGYYRVNYPFELWQTLIKALETDPNTLSAVDRAHLLNDAFALADSTQLGYDVALDLTRYLKKETEYLPWSVTSSKFSFLRMILQYTDIYEEFVEYGRDLVNKVYETVGWDIDEDHLKNRLRISVLELACSLEHPDCMKEVALKFQEFLKNPEDRPKPDIRNIIYYYGMMAVGNEGIWNQIWKLFKDEKDPNEKLKLMRSLSGIQVPWILNKFIDLAWDQENVRGQDYFTCLAYIAQNPVGESLVWNYVRENWEKLVNRFGLNERYLGRLIPQITAAFSTKTNLKEMELFFKEYPEAGAGTAARKQALQKVKVNIKWLEINKRKVGEWLKNNRRQ